MRKLKLIVASLALLVGGANFSAFAQQQDVTSTFLTNASFTSGTAIDNNVCTYGKDMEANGTTYYGAQPIEGWTNASVGTTADNYDNCTLAGAIFEYGSTPWLAGSGTVAPATDPEGNAGNAAGLCAVWGGSIQYTQDVTLPAGSYTLRFKVFNSTTNNGSGKFITTNLFGFVPNEGTAYYAPNKTFAIGQWSSVAVTFNLTEETAGKISMGFVGPSGNANMPHLFVDNVKILKNTYYEDVTNKVGIAQADWGGTETNVNKVTTSDGRSINMIADYGQSSGRPMEQTITGLKKGTYEAVVYAYSQMEWKDQATWLNHDAGDVGYVLAEGQYQIKEWINARRGPGYPADGPGIYCLSGIEVGDEGTLTISYNLAKADQTEWHGLQIQSLIYTKNLDLSGFIASYNTALSNAKTASATTQKVSATLLAQLNSVIDTYDEGKVDKEDGDALEAAATALTEATEKVNTSIASYAIIATGVIPDNSLNGWVCENSNTFHINTWSVEGNPGNDPSNMVTPFIENWVNKNDGYLGAGKVYYRLEGLEPGEVYYASALVRSYNEKNSDAPNGPNFYINNIVTDLATDGKTFTYNGMSGIYATLGGTATIGEDGILELGVVINEDRNYNWVAFKNVRMQELAAAYNTAFAAAEALEGTIPSAAFYAMESALYTTYSEVTVENIANINTLVETNSALVAPYANWLTSKAKAIEVANGFEPVTTAINIFAASIEEYTDAESINTDNAYVNNLINNYSVWCKLKNSADALVAVSNDNAEANETLASTITAEFGLLNKTIADRSEAIDYIPSILTVASEVKTAMRTYVFAANPTKGNRFDLTFLMTNPDLTGFKTWEPAAGWASEETDGNSQVMVNDSKTVGDKSYFYEYWSETAKASGKFALYNAVTLPAGTFSMSCYAFAEDQGNSGSPTFDGVFFYANETQGSCVTSNVLAEQSISFINETGQDVKIGLKTLTGNTRNWMGIGYVNLYKEYTDNTTYAISVPSFDGSATVTVDDVEAEKAKALKTVTVTVTPAAGYVVTGVAATYNDGEVRTLDVANPSANVYTFQMPAYDVTVTVTTFQPVVNITDAGWATYSSPYALDFSGVFTDRLENVYIVTGANGDYLELESVMGGTVPANTGLLLEGCADFVGTVNIPVAASGTTDVSANKLVPVIEEYTITSGYVYVLMKEGSDVAFYQTIYDFTVGANTAYLPAGFADGYAPAAFQFITEVTGISEVNAEAASGEIYNLAGQRVSKAVKGLYIQNGKKILVK